MSLIACSLSSVLPLSTPSVVPPSPRKCLAVAKIWLGPRKSLPLPCRPSIIALPSLLTSSGSSEKPSYALPQESFWGTAMVGANVQTTPVLKTSKATASPISLMSSGLWVAPRPILCGNKVAPLILLCPWTASVPQSTGIRTPSITGDAS